MSQQKSDHNPPHQTQASHEAKNMDFFAHLDELRVRIMRCTLIFVIGFVICYCFADQLLGVLRKPLFDVLPEAQRKLYFTSLFENFMTHLKISGYASLFLFSPLYFQQLWAFITPGLYPKERKLFIPFVLAATFFFVGGACFAYFILFPVGFKYFVTYGAPSDVPLLTIGSYYDTCLKLMLLFGLSFELPVLVVLLGYLGLVDAPTLRQHRRTAIVIIAVAAALFAPPDAVSMLILGGPLVLLFEASILVVGWLGVKRTRKSIQEEYEQSNPLEGRSKK